MHSSIMPTRPCTLVQVAWQERDKALWAGGAAPKIELTYDVHYGFLLTVLFHLDKKRCVDYLLAARIETK